MSDIVERLRDSTFLAVTHPHFAGVAKNCSEAADEIERLRKLIDGAAETGEVYERRLSECEAENDALRTRLAEATLACGHPASLLLRSTETGEPLYCELCDDKSGRRDAEQREVDLQARLAEAEALLRVARDCLYATSTSPWADETVGRIDAFLAREGKP